jgi:hypothetical protein
MFNFDSEDEDQENNRGENNWVETQIIQPFKNPNSF